MLLGHRLLILEKEHPADLEVYRATLAAEVPGLDLRIAASEQEALTLCGECDAIAAKAHNIPVSVTDRMPRLRWIQSLTTGVDHLATLNLADDVVITSARGIHGPQMAELAFLSMLTLARDFPRMQNNQRAARWERWPQKLLDGRTLLIVGIGAIGEEIAMRATIFGMVVIGASDGRETAPNFSSIVPLRALADQVAKADFVVVVTPYSPRTHHLIDANILRAMRNDAYLINIARGNVVDETALIAALERGDIAGAAADVFAQEPLPTESKLWATPNLIITPHIGGMSDRYAHQVLPILTANARAFAEGRPQEMINRVTAYDAV